MSRIKPTARYYNILWCSYELPENKELAVSSFSLSKARRIVIIIRYAYIQHFNYQLMHTTLKTVELLKHFKISKTAPTCFGLQGNHHQGATIST